MIVIGPICFMLVTLAALLWAAGVLPSDLALRSGVAAIAVYFLNAVAMKTVVVLHTRRRQREAASAVRKLREATLEALMRNDYILCLAAEDLRAGDLVRLEEGKVKKVRVLPHTAEGAIQ